jgi:uncharacterized membrane protein
MNMIGAPQGFVHGTRSYLIVTAVFGLIVAVLDSTALAIMGVPLVVLWGVLAFITNFIPNIGFTATAHDQGHRHTAEVTPSGGRHDLTCRAGGYGVRSESCPGRGAGLYR